jgi:NAD+ synthase
MLIYTDKVYSYLRDWISLSASKSYKNGFVSVFTGGLDSALTIALCLKASVVAHNTIVFMGFKKDNEELLENWINSNFGSESFTIIKPNHPKLVLPGLEGIDQQASFIPAYVDLYCKSGNALSVGAVTRSEYNLVKFFRTRIDDVYDCYPIIDLYKSECKVLAKHIGLPDKIINSKSITEESFGFSFDQLEWLDREDDNIKIVSSLSNPNSSKFWGLYNQNNKELVHKVFQLDKLNKTKVIPEQEKCLIRKALPGILE